MFHPDRRHRLETVDSTNLALKRLAAEGAPVGTVVTARQQTAGYGQRGRSWVSEPDAGLYLSCLVPALAVPTHLPFLLGVACKEALGAWTDEVGLKWVNDLVARRLKLGGLLVEMTRHGAVAGIGINLRSQPVEGAIALEDLGASPTPDEVVARVLTAIERWHQRYQVEGYETLQSAWTRSSVTLGREVQVMDSEPPLAGVAEALGPSGELMVRQADGTTVPVISGTIRTPEGAYC